MPAVRVTKMLPYPILILSSSIGKLLLTSRTESFVCVQHKPAFKPDQITKHLSQGKAYCSRYRDLDYCLCGLCPPQKSACPPEIANVWANLIKCFPFAWPLEHWFFVICVSQFLYSSLTTYFHSISLISVTRLGDILDFGQLFKVFSSN